MLFCKLNTAGGFIISILGTDVCSAGILRPLVKSKIQDEVEEW